MTEHEMMSLAYNAHEWAEVAASEAIRAKLEEMPIEALSCLADPQWGWSKRSFISPLIVDQADDILTDKLEALVLV